jgi:DNA (cytosine-5)-methyltransferase 1
MKSQDISTFAENVMGIDGPIVDRNYQITPELIEKAKSGRTHVVSFFSGAGGLDIGAQLAGAKVISAHDFDSDSVKTLKLNAYFDHTAHFLGDIATSQPTDFKDVIEKQNPDKLIIVGGPPCQPFSKAGYWTTLKNRLSHNDPRNMIGNYFKMIAEIKPDGFLLENVESLLHPHNRFALESITELIDSLGYKYKLVKANAIDYGVAQKRKRVFFICSKRNFKTDEPIKTHGSNEDILKMPHLLPYECVFNWIGKYDTMQYFEKEELTNKGTYHFDLLDVPPGKNYIAITAAAGYPNPKFIAQKRFWNFLLKLHPAQPSWTIAAQPGPWVGPFHWTSRRLRVPEIAAIQAFPENYVYAGNRRSVQKQIGNAVPPLLGKAMVEFLMHNI